VRKNIPRKPPNSLSDVIPAGDVFWNWELVPGLVGGVIRGDGDENAD
jgi:hypothetical protein